MADSALLKLDWAAKRVAELNELLREKRPFRYILKTDAETGERTIFAKKDQAVADEAALIGGDAVHNIRTAIDYAYWAIVSPFAESPRAAKAVQFPFSATKDGLEEIAKNRLAHKVSAKFFDAIIALAPHSEEGGNRLLYLIDKLDIPERHRDLTPTADYKLFRGADLLRQVPDLPVVAQSLELAGNESGDFRWFTKRVDRQSLGNMVPPTTCVFEKELDVPMNIVFKIGAPHNLTPAIPLLNKLIDVGKETIRLMRRAAP